MKNLKQFLAKVIHKKGNKTDNIIASSNIIWAVIPDNFISALAYYRKTFPNATLTLDKNNMPIPIPMEYKKGKGNGEK